LRKKTKIPNTWRPDQVTLTFIILIGLIFLDNKDHSTSGCYMQNRFDFTIAISTLLQHHGCIMNYIISVTLCGIILLVAYSQLFFVYQFMSYFVRTYIRLQLFEPHKKFNKIKIIFLLYLHV
jgi:hypothetical protein